LIAWKNLPAFEAVLCRVVVVDEESEVVEIVKGDLRREREDRGVDCADIVVSSWGGAAGVCGLEMVRSGVCGVSRKDR
jgi:hypothetical protein